MQLPHPDPSRVSGRRSLGILRGLLAAALMALSPATSVAQGQATRSHVEFAATVEQTKGHLLASLELYTKRDRAMAAVHAGHPIQETWSLLQAPLTRINQSLADRVQAALQEPGHAVEMKIPGPRYDTVVKQVFVTLDEAVERAVPANVRATLSFKKGVIEALIEEVAHEYEEAVDDGKIVNVAEYQDAYGFLRRAQDLHRAISADLRRTSPRAAADIEVDLATLRRALTGVRPPGSPVAVAVVKRAAEGIGRALRNQ